MNFDESMNELWRVPFLVKKQELSILIKPEVIIENDQNLEIECSINVNKNKHQFKFRQIKIETGAASRELFGGMMP